MIDLIYSIATYIALAAMALAFIRFILGPKSVDRVVALDALTIISISLIVCIACLKGRTIYIDIALVYGLISFIGIVAIARYLERGM